MKREKERISLARTFLARSRTPSSVCCEETRRKTKIAAKDIVAGAVAVNLGRLLVCLEHKQRQVPRSPVPVWKNLGRVFRRKLTGEVASSLPRLCK
jgi:hypothetical protein